jgi:hypothetical protein
MLSPKQPNDAEAVRVARVRQLFEAQRYAERTENEVLIFFGWLEERYPHLLSTEWGDTFRQLKVDLKGLYKG